MVKRGQSTIVAIVFKTTYNGIIFKFCIMSSILVHSGNFSVFQKILWCLKLSKGGLPQA